MPKKILGVNIKYEYHKISSLKAGKKLVDNFRSQKDNDLTVVVYNFVDMLSHSKTEMEVIKELGCQPINLIAPLPIAGLITGPYWRSSSRRRNSGLS